ncbi:MAG: ABC transporter ATP-binding protein [Candidatus Bipolaricaulis sp.]|nr:ABC transporter ATP-binding protein [Candidatus Bipolaricaulis sp.]MDD5646625.1 ABC transporter ATP-binding protein [Candidatus Bipolaricaulis sp.]
MSLLSVRDVHSGYGDMQILHGVDLDVNAEEVVTIIGPNGAGKSTLMKTIFGLLRLTRGQIEFEGREISGLSADRIVRLGLAYVPQVDNVFPSLTVRENLELGAFVDRHAPRRRVDRVYELFPALRPRQTKRVGTMSGGERQMVAMGRALMLDPKLLMLDEPSAALAPNLAATIFDRISAVNQGGTAVLIVEQNAKESLRRSHRGYVLAAGRKCFEDEGPAILANEDIGRLYLGGA